RAEPFDCHPKPALTRLFACAGPTRNPTTRGSAHPSQRSRSRCPFVGCWREAPPAGGAGTEPVSHSFPGGTRIHGLSWRERDQQPLANQGTNSGTHPGEVSAARLKAEAHLCTANYLRPHHGAGGFRTAAQVPA